MNVHRLLGLVASLAAALCGSAALFAAEVAPVDAMRAAKAWVGLGRSMGKIPVDRAVVSVDQIEDPATGARLFVAKFEGGGFVVMAADDLIDPVISFSATDDGVVTDEASPYWALLRGDIAAREAAAGIVRNPTAAGGTPSPALLRSAAPPVKTATQRKWAELLGESDSDPRPSGAALLRTTATVVSAPSDIRVDSFVASRWNQSTHNNYANGQNCYSYYTPNNYICGCVATAGAQIMRYWQYPTASVAAKTFTCSVGGTSAAFTMMGGIYDWSSMPLVPANGVTEVQCQAIGKLTYDVGVSVGMAWASASSGANLFALVRRLKDTFGYSSAEAAVYMSSYYPYTLAKVKQTVIPNCNARGPLAMSISGTSGGHAVLVDGYGYSGTDFYMHVNFGWSGSGDAWYSPPDIGEFTTIGGFVFNIFPEKTGSIISGRVLDATGAPIGGASVSLARNATTVDATTADANGIYAFVASAGDYLVTASSGSVSATIGVSLAATAGTRLSDSGAWYNSAASIGNTSDSDITLTGLAGVTPPVFSPEPCLFYPSTNVAITCADAGAAIHYTLDGTNPDETSPLYTGPIFVDDTVTIRARAFVSGLNPSPVVSATYTYDSSAGAPKGDHFDNPITISGAAGSRVIDDNAAYTIEAGEPWHTLENHRYYYQYRSAWYKWTAPGSGTMVFGTKCSGGGYVYPTYIAVYTGDELAAIERLAFSTTVDDNYETSLSIAVEQGVTYRIVGMMGYDGSGAFTLSWSGDLAVARSPYETWAAEKGLGGPGEVTAGVANAFRYVFGIPSAAFSPISAIGFDASGRVVLTLPTIVNTGGVTLSVLSTTDITDWTPPVAEERSVAVGADGTLTFDDDAPARFYRLKAVVRESDE